MCSNPCFRSIMNFSWFVSFVLIKFRKNHQFVSNARQSISNSCRSSTSRDHICLKWAFRTLSKEKMCTREKWGWERIVFCIDVYVSTRGSRRCLIYISFEAFDHWCAGNGYSWRISEEFQSRIRDEGNKGNVFFFLNEKCALSSWFIHLRQAWTMDIWRAGTKKCCRLTEFIYSPFNCML